MNTLIVIPARYASTRFPGKPLALLAGKPVLQWVCDALRPMQDAHTRLVVATDDQRILTLSQQQGVQAQLTSQTCRSGTDRCGEVLRSMHGNGWQPDVVVNVQGDEPFTDPTQVASLVEAFADADVQIATLATTIGTTAELLSPNNVKVVRNSMGMALYFSRQALPYRRGVEVERWIAEGRYLKHVGIYAYRASVLQQVCQIAPSALETAESLEQLRWLENGYSIKVIDTPHANIGIDTPEDLASAEVWLSKTQTYNK